METLLIPLFLKDLAVYYVLSTQQYITVINHITYMSLVLHKTNMNKKEKKPVLYHKILYLFNCSNTHIIRFIVHTNIEKYFLFEKEIELYYG